MSSDSLQEQYNQKIYELRENIESKCNTILQPNCLTNYLTAEILISQGNYEEGVKLITDSLNEIQLSKHEYQYQRLYESLSSLLANTYDSLGLFEQAEKIYIELLQEIPISMCMGEYAIFLHRRKRDFEKAESFYSKAIELYPTHSSIIMKFAGFQRHAKKNLTEAEKYYRQACNVNPTNSDAIGNLASFLHGAVFKMDEAENEYKRAIDIDGSNCNNLCNYGLFLCEIRKDYPNAEKFYKQVLELDPKHTNTIYNYAVMLDTNCQRKLEAEMLYRECISFNPMHSYALYNLAVLLEEKYSNQHPLTTDSKPRQPSKEISTDPLLIEIKSFYQLALDIDSGDFSSLADYGRFLLLRLEDVASAEAVLQKSLKLNENCEIALYHLGLLYHRYQNNAMKAEQYLRKVVMLNPGIGACGAYQQLARILIEYYNQEMNSPSSTNSIKLCDKFMIEALDLYEKGILKSKDCVQCAQEYLKLLCKPVSNIYKMRGISFMENTLNANNSMLSTSISRSANALNVFKSLIEGLRNSISNSG